MPSIDTLEILVERLDATATAGEAWRATLDVFDRLGFDRVAYGFASHLTNEDGAAGVSMWSNWPDWYARRYTEMGYARHDPSVHHCMVSLAPAYQGVNHFAGRVDGVTRQLIDEAAECGVRSGIVIPTRSGPAIAGISFSNRMDIGEFRRFLGERQAIVRLAAVYAHTRIQALLKSEGAACLHLTPRERECLLWSATGMASKEVARRLGVSPKVIDFHILHACRKLGVVNRTHAVARALTLGLIAL